MSGMPDVSVVVVGYNSRRFLPSCFDALSKQVYPGRYEILFVDNASTDGSAAFVRERYPEVRVILNEQNSGYAGGNNLGAQGAQGGLLAFVNPDTAADPQWLVELVRPLMSDPTIGLTTSKIVLMERPDLINAAGNDLSLAGITTCRYAGQPASSVVRDEEVPAVSGAAFAIWTELFRELGGFDERFWMYLEDTDLSWRARLAGYRIVLAPRSVVAHDYRFNLSPAKLERIERNRYLMLGKNLSAGSLLALLPVLLLVECLTWGWALVRGPHYLMAKVRALVDALRQAWAFGGARHEPGLLRRRSDQEVLRQFPPVPGLGDAGGGLGRLATAAIGPLIALLSSVSLFLIGTGRPSQLTTLPFAGYLRRRRAGW